MKEKFDKASEKTKQGFEWEDELVSQLNHHFQNVPRQNKELKAYTLRSMGAGENAAIKYVYDKKPGMDYMWSNDVYQGDVYIYDETHEKQGKLLARIGCKSCKDGTTFGKEQLEFLKSQGTYVAIAIYNESNGLFMHKRIVPGRSMLEVHALTDMTLGPAVDFIPTQNIMLANKSMSVYTFANELSSGGLER